MPSFFAASFAFFKSREAIAAISLHSPFCIPGITFFVAIDAAPRTPHFTFPKFATFPSVSMPLLSRRAAPSNSSCAPVWLLSSRLRLAPCAGPRDVLKRRIVRMRKGITILLLGMLALSAPPAANRLWGQAEKKDAMPDPAVKVGDMAPDFTLMDTHRNQVSLHDFRGKKNVALAFYIFAFTGG